MLPFKTGPLHNPANRDHCLQYMVAVALIFGRLTPDDYEDEVAVDPRIDGLRDNMEVTENNQYSIDYLDPEKRSIANAVQLFFVDGARSDKVEIEFPMGHRCRRAEGVPELKKKFAKNIATRLSSRQCEKILVLCEDQERLESTPVHEFVDLFVV